jgi:ParB family chromosome partitioning protein
MTEDNTLLSWTIREIPVEQIVPDPEQPRKAFDEAAVIALGENMKDIGQLTPILVFEVDVVDSTRNGHE